jgi:PAS domain S-box-containing protein
MSETVVARETGAGWRRHVPDRQQAPTLLVVAVGYALTARLGLALDPVGGVATAVWPPSGIALAALLMGGTRLWPAVALGAFVANVWVGVPAWAALGIAAGNTLEAVLGALLLRRLAGFRPALDRVSDVLALAFLAAMLCTTVSATIGLAMTWLAGKVPPGGAALMWRMWWLGDMLGILLVAPPLLLWATVRTQAWPPRRVLEAALVLGAVFGLAWRIFGHVDPAGSNLPYLLFPVLLLATVRFGQPGAAYGLLIAASVAVAGTATGLGPYFDIPVLADRLFVLQTFMATASLTMLLLGAYIAERRQAATALSRQGELLRRVFDRMPVMLTIYRPDTAVLELNRHFEQLTGWSTAEARQVDLMAECYPDPAYRAWVRSYMDSMPEGWRDIDMTTRDGQVLATSWTLMRLSDDTHVGIGLDIRERRRGEAEREQLLAALASERNQLQALNEALEERVGERTRQVRALASALALAEQQERARLSQVLHDDLQQLLYGQLLRLRVLRDGLDAEDLALVEGELDEMGRLLRQAIELTRTLVAELHPPGIDPAGLDVAIQALAERMTREHGLHVAVEVTTPVAEVDRDIAALLLPMVREVLFNVVKHAGTPSARVAIAQDDHRLSLVVADDGQGFDARGEVSPMPERRGYGLSSIQERLSLIGGRLEVASQPGAGTRVTIHVPLAPAQPSTAPPTAPPTA